MMTPPAKRRKIPPKTEEVTFDSAARHEFLTGFRKRKQQRTRHAQEVAEKRAKEDARLEKKRMREERTAEFQRAVDEHRRQLEMINERGEGEGGQEESGNESGEGEDEWEGFEEPPAVDYEAEYIDEDKYTTVTVEEMDASREGLLKSRKEDSSDEERPQPVEHAPETVKKTKPKDRPKKKPKFRYESKEDRKLNQVKQRLSNSKKAAARRQR